MKALSPIAYIIGVGEIIRTQYMIPNHMDKQFNVCIILNAIINLVLTFLFIPILGVYGAVVGTLAAEIFGVVYQMLLCRKNINVYELLKSSFPFVIIGFIMYVVIRCVALRIDGTTFALIVQVLIGMSTYCILGTIYIFLFRKDIASMMLSKIRRKADK